MTRVAPEALYRYNDNPPIHHGAFAPADNDHGEVKAIATIPLHRIVAIESRFTGTYANCIVIWVDQMPHPVVVDFNDWMEEVRDAGQAQSDYFETLEAAITANEEGVP